MSATPATGKRAIEALALPNTARAVISGAPPVMRMVNPTDLYVDESYQRGLSDRSARLIQKIVAEWDWSAFKPPIVVEIDERLEVIDGQHTAIAAVSHGEIHEIPVLVAQAPDLAGRANAFVRHNRDRIQVTPTQLHNAMVAAGDDDAVTVDQVCARSGVRILRNPPQMGRFRPGETLAIVTVRSLINRRHAIGARKVLEVCASAQLAPVSADMIKAIECLLFAEEYKGEIDPERIVLVLNAMGDALLEEAARFAAERKMPRWRALASTIFMNRRKGRRDA